MPPPPPSCAARFAPSRPAYSSQVAPPPPQPKVSSYTYVRPLSLMSFLLPSCCYHIRNSYWCPCTCVRNHYTWYGIAESKVLYWDTTIKYFIKEQLLYAMAAIVILIIFVLSPALLLFCYPTKIFRKCSSYCRHRRWQVLHAFAEKFQGCYKDGVDGTKISSLWQDCIW